MWCASPDQAMEVLQVVSPFIDAATTKKIIFLYESEPKEMIDSFDHEVRAQNPAALGLGI